jgi:hypothetical protein
MQNEDQKIIDAESVGSSEKFQAQDDSGKITETRHPVLGITYELFINGEKYVQQAVGEHRLGVRVKQFDRYCKMINPPVIKIRKQTERYSYNFIKEIDLERMAHHYQKVMRIPLEEIPHTDQNKKTLSVTDAKAMALEQAQVIFKDLYSRVNVLETKNEELHNEVSRLNLKNAEIIETKSKEINAITAEKQEVIEKKNEEIIKLAKENNQINIEKTNIDNKKKEWKFATLAACVVLLTGGGVAWFFLYSINKDNDRLYDERKQDHVAIISLNADDSNWRTKSKIQDDEINQLKGQIPALQNQEINSVKKD